MKCAADKEDAWSPLKINTIADTLDKHDVIDLKCSFKPSHPLSETTQEVVNLGKRAEQKCQKKTNKKTAVEIKTFINSPRIFINHATITMSKY